MPGRFYVRSFFTMKTSDIVYLSESWYINAYYKTGFFFRICGDLKKKKKTKVELRCKLPFDAQVKNLGMPTKTSKLPFFPGGMNLQLAGYKSEHRGS